MLPADFAVSESDDFFLDKVNAPFNFSAGEALRSGRGSWSGSMICGMLVEDSVGISSVATATGLVSASISGDDKVR